MSTSTEIDRVIKGFLLQLPVPSSHCLLAAVGTWINCQMYDRKSLKWENVDCNHSTMIILT